MNKKKISAEPREASKAPLSPRGKASKKTTTTSADNRAEIEKTVSDILGDILDKKLCEIMGNINERLNEINERLNEIKDERPLPLHGPSEAIPAYYKKSKPGIRQVVFDKSEWESSDEEYYEPNERAIRHDMCDTNETANEINSLDPKKIGDLIYFLNTQERQGEKRGGLFLRTTRDLLNFPRLAIRDDEPYIASTLENGVTREIHLIDVKIGALQLFETAPDEDEAARIDEEARAPFDTLLSAAMRYIETAEKEFPYVEGDLHAVRDNLQTLAELLAQCIGIPGSSECYEVSDAAKAAIEAAKRARITLESNPLCIFAAKVEHIVKTEGWNQHEVISDLIQKGYAGAFPIQTTEVAAEGRLRRAGLLGNPRATKTKKQKPK